MVENLQINEYEIIRRYKDVMMGALQFSFPLLSQVELSDAIDYSIVKRCKNGPAVIKNNYNNKQINSTVLEVLDYIMSCEPIVTSAGVFFKKHKESDNPLARMIRSFVDLRKIHKKEMFKYPKGSAQFEKYNLLQLLDKLDGNATYGCLGSPTSLYYNIYTAEAITRQGRSYISCSIMLFESFLSNNVKFNNLNEVITFINNVVNEKHERKFNDKLILDRDIMIEEAFFKVMNTADMMVWVPTEKEMSLVWEYLLGLTQEDLNRVYYKNNLYSFAELPVVMNMIINTLSKLEEPFMNPNEPPEYIMNDLEAIYDLMYEYVYYHYFYIDKLDRIEYMKRDICIICDTDSTIISLDAWYNFVLQHVYNIDMKVKKEKFNMIDIIDADEFGDRPLRKMCEIVEPNYDYDFYTDEMIELDCMIEPCKVVPQDCLKYSIINIIAYICGKLVIDYLEQYSKNTLSYKEGKVCELVMKNEFTFLRALLSKSKRNYLDYQVLQEGNIIPEDERLAIMGMPINKSTLPDGIKKKFRNILLEEIIKSDNIDQVKLMKELVKVEKTIYDNIMSGKTDYYKPSNIAAISSYDNPLGKDGIVASLIYNELRDPDMPFINLEERNKVIIVKLKVDKKSAVRIKDTYPEVYEKLMKLFDHPTLGSKIKYIALPLDVKPPKWVLEFVDFKLIINDNLKNFPVESCGLLRLGQDTVNYSNIIKL